MGIQSTVSMKWGDNMTEQKFKEAELQLKYIKRLQDQLSLLESAHKNNEGNRDLNRFVYNSCSINVPKELDQRIYDLLKSCYEQKIEQAKKEFEEM